VSAKLKASDAAVYPTLSRNTFHRESSQIVDQRPSESIDIHGSLLDVA
jgi:hypothetical protein